MFSNVSNELTSAPLDRLTGFGKLFHPNRQRSGGQAFGKLRKIVCGTDEVMTFANQWSADSVDHLSGLLNEE